MPPLTLDGTTGVSAVQAGAVESKDLPAGSVIQVKHVVTRTQVIVTAGNTVVDLGLSISIDPTSSNSKFLLFCKVHARTTNVNNSGYGLVWFRDNTEIRSPNKYYEVLTGSLALLPSHFQYFDNPQTNATITYEAKPETFNNEQVTFGTNGEFDHNLTVMEIAG